MELIISRHVLVYYTTQENYMMQLIFILPIMAIKNFGIHSELKSIGLKVNA